MGGWMYGWANGWMASRLEEGRSCRMEGGGAQDGGEEEGDINLAEGRPARLSLSPSASLTRHTHIYTHRHTCPLPSFWQSRQGRCTVSGQELARVQGLSSPARCSLRGWNQKYQISPVRPTEETHEKMCYEKTQEQSILMKARQRRSKARQTSQRRVEQETQLITAKHSHPYTSDSNRYTAAWCWITNQRKWTDKWKKVEGQAYGDEFGMYGDQEVSWQQYPQRKKCSLSRWWPSKNMSVIIVKVNMWTFQLWLRPSTKHHSWRQAFVKLLSWKKVFEVSNDYITCMFIRVGWVSFFFNFLILVPNEILKHSCA